MADTFLLKVVTPERVVYENAVVSVVAPGADGYFGVLAHHAPMLAEVGIGHLMARDASGAEEILAVCGGFAEVREGHMSVLADAAERKSDIDIRRAEEARERARRRLDGQDENVDSARAQAALLRAINRLDTAARK